ncbi:hypothetical protein [Streptomyces sp. BE133]|uniref:hypothetical protein n=1 Tax=Streptomyces sp. BE133 TaxID=3002523 RepID=UPI002E759FDB|nr:hypothetical protein [Streptomyces sp. BE133]MEE1809250.1 hypothetical protein [Streptomyces sp. BE133]
MRRRSMLPAAGAEALRAPLAGRAFAAAGINDGLHPNKRGHHRLAPKMIKDLRVLDIGSRVCSLRVP